MLYLGIDQHHRQITVSLRNDEGSVILRRQVSTRPEKTRTFLQELREQSGEEGFMAILEVCGFNDWLIALLREYGCREIVLIHPDKRSKRKTDRRDAGKLGEQLWLNKERLRKGEKPEGLRRHNRIWEQPTKTFQTKKVRGWLSELELPPIDRLEMDQLLVQWESREEQITQLDAQIDVRFQHNAAAQLLSTVPGAGAYSSLAIASRIGSIERFAGPRSLANYFGLVPGCRNSGEATDRLGSITKEGSGMVRFIVGQLVLHVLKKDAWLRQWYRRIRRRRGSKIARVAVMRRLVTIFWHMLTYNEPYCAGGPPRLRHKNTRREEVSSSA